MYLPLIVACKIAKKNVKFYDSSCNCLTVKLAKYQKYKLKVSYLHGVTNDEKYIVISGTIGVRINLNND